jgi:hypothetical protein
VLRGGIAFDGTTLARDGESPPAPWWREEALP